MRIEVDGVQYGDFVSATATLRLDALSNTFSFEATSENARPLPFRGGEECRVSADGEVVITGFIEKVDVGGAADEHTIKLEGRDKTGDLVDSSIANLSDLQPPISLRKIIQKVITHVGVGISVVDQVGPELFSESEDLAAPEPGQNAFEFIEALARKRQVLLTSDASGNVVISSGSGVEASGYIHHRAGSDDNNVLSYSVSYDDTGRFRAYRAVSQLNMIPLNVAGETGAEPIVDQGSEVVVVDQAIRAGRQHVLVSESSGSEGEGEKRARWERNVRRVRGRVYSATVHGFRDQAGDLWAINSLVPVADEFAGIDARMLVNSVTFNQSLEEGRTTALSFVDRKAYQLELAEPEEEEGLGLGIL